MLVLEIENTNNVDQSNLKTIWNNPIKYLTRQYGRFFLIRKPRSLEVTANNMDNTHQEQGLNDLDTILKCRRWPFFILMISAIQLFAFNYHLVQSNEHTSNLPVEFVGLSLSDIALRLIFNPFQRHEFWRYVTYIFVHFGFFHLIGNLMLQIFLGMPLEIMYGSWQILLLYMTSVISAAMFQSYYDPTKYLAGASGGVYALYGAHIGNLISNWKQMYSPALQLMVFGVLGLIVLYQTIKNFNPITSYECHAVGAVVGFLFGLTLNKKFKRILLRLPTKFWKYFVMAVSLIVVIYITYQNYFIFPELNILSSVAGTSATNLNSSF